MAAQQWHQEIEVALTAANEAAEIARAMQQGITAEDKTDGSPVTAADKKCEAAIVKRLSEAFPGDGIMGEEGASVESKNGRRWIIDPIDGTRDYIRGNHLWANLIALEADGEIVAGVTNLPMLDEIYHGAKGLGAYKNGSTIQVSSKTDFNESVLCVNGFNRLHAVPFRTNLLDHLSDFWAVRCLGGAADAMLVAQGKAEIWVEPQAAPWDLAPLKIILEEAGAKFFDLKGKSTIYSTHALACTPNLTDALKQLIESE